MYTYEEFFEEFEKELGKRFPEAELIRKPQYKFNGIKHGLIIMGSGDVHPTVYPEDFYKLYQEYEEIELVVDAVEASLECDKIRGFKDVLLDWNKVKESVFPFIVNLKNNEACLECNDYVFQKKLDFAYGVFVELQDDEGGHANVNITKGILRLWGVSEEEIFSIAEQNAKYEVKPMRQVIAELTGFDDSEIDISEDNMMYVLSSENRNRGAAGMFKLDLLNKMAERLQSDLYILPSSIHELILLPTEAAPDKEMLRSMIEEINDTQVASTELLSYNLYCYYRTTNDVAIVSMD